MGLYNFQERFVPFVQDGSKPHTIRAIRKNFTKVGDTMHLYTGLRVTKPAKKLIDPLPACTAKRTIIIFADKEIYLSTIIVNKDCADMLQPLPKKKILKVFGEKIVKLSKEATATLAYNDGFRWVDKDVENMASESKITEAELFFRFWSITHTLPFIGHLDCWHKNPSQLIYLS